MWLIAISVAAGSAAMFAFNWFAMQATMRADPGNKSQVAEGKAIYESTCAACHGWNLEGQPDWRRRLPNGAYPAPPHDESGHTWHHPDSILFKMTKDGGQAVAPGGFISAMPAFVNVLSDREIWAVLAYVKSRWPDHIQRRQAEVSQRSRE